MKIKYGLSIWGILLISLVLSGKAFADDAKTYAVTITNITKGQSFTPIVVITHKSGHPLFELGSPASDELVAIAESGNTQPLQMKLLDSGMAYEAVSSEGLLEPGKSVTLKVNGKGKFKYISLASMLLPTNDGFIALNGVAAPKGMKHAKMRIVPAYDAGSEINDELCASIPGPHCGGSALSPEDGEGYVYIHSGIHGVGDLPASERDWHNPVAKVKIMRVQ